MHDIEPYYRWREYYIASEDPESPFYGKVNSEFQFSDRIYNYYIHPQWDDFGSSTLYAKLLFVNYHDGYAFIELIGEWNDIHENDIDLLHGHIGRTLMHRDVHKFIFLCDNVLNFHGDGNDYYEEWWDEVREEDGYLCSVNLQQHVMQEMVDQCVHHFMHVHDELNEVQWRQKDPQIAFQLINSKINSCKKQLTY